MLPGPSAARSNLFFPVFWQRNYIEKFCEILLVWGREILPSKSARVLRMCSQELKGMECNHLTAENHQCDSQGNVAPGIGPLWSI